MQLSRPDIDELAKYATLISGTEPEANLAKSLSPEDLLAQLDYHGITLLADDYGSLPPNLAKITGQRKAMMVANESLKRNALAKLFSTFDDAGLKDHVLFKGSALAYSVYKKPWLRPRTDSDILVNAYDRQRFDAVFTDLGYRKHFAVEGDYVSYQSTYSKALAGQSTMNIDLHWRINNRQILAQTFTVSELLSNAETLGALSEHVSIPSKVNNIIIASLHRLGHHQKEERLAWLYDIHLLVCQLSNTEWLDLLSQTQNKKLSAITLDALEYCIALFSTEVPDEHLSALNVQAKAAEPSAVLLRRGLPEWRYFLYDLASLNKATEKLGFIKETLFPNPAYVRQQMNTNSTVLAYLKRLNRGIRRVL